MSSFGVVFQLGRFFTVRLLVVFIAASHWGEFCNFGLVHKNQAVWCLLIDEFRKRGMSERFCAECFSLFGSFLWG